MPKLRSKVKPDGIPSILETVPHWNFRRRVIPLLILELTAIQANQFEESRHETVRQRHLEMIGTLRTHDALGIHRNRIWCGLPAEHRMVVQSQTGGLRAGLRWKEHCCGKAADSSTQHNKN